MDERAINGAAIEAISDLQLDCEIKDVCQSSSGDEWCIQFSGKYGRFCDSFVNQFGKDSSPEVIREKIKGYLIKQVNKIRGTTGRRRRPAIIEARDEREVESGILAAPLRMVGELFERAVGLAGGVATQAASMAETAREVVTDAAANITPVTIEVRSTTRKAKRSASSATARKTVKSGKAAPAKAKKRVKRQAVKQTQKVGKKAVKKTVKKSSKRGK